MDIRKHMLDKQERKTTTPNVVTFQKTAQMINWVSVLNHT